MVYDNATIQLRGPDALTNFSTPQQKSSIQEKADQKPLSNSGYNSEEYSHKTDSCSPTYVRRYNSLSVDEVDSQSVKESCETGSEPRDVVDDSCCLSGENFSDFSDYSSLFPGDMFSSVPNFFDDIGDELLSSCGDFEFEFGAAPPHASMPNPQADGMEFFRQESFDSGLLQDIIKSFFPKPKPNKSVSDYTRNSIVVVQGLNNHRSSSAAFGEVQWDHMSSTRILERDTHTTNESSPKSNICT
ncbi:hypothetical protein V6N12_067821 [Hibiscus sabdariffa]|uniref:Uncharacterized protein n=1 Tax=Hibiscus sabdariffa TaxID=183260 RepID=A0ABR2FN56_9ROSI